MTRGELPDPAAAKLLEAALVAAARPRPTGPLDRAARMAITCGVGSTMPWRRPSTYGDGPRRSRRNASRSIMPSPRAWAAVPVSQARLAQAVSAEMKRWPTGRRMCPLRHRFSSPRSACAAPARNGRGRRRRWRVRGASPAIGRALEAELARDKDDPSPEYRRRDAVVFAELVCTALCRDCSVLSRRSARWPTLSRRCRQASATKAIPRHLLWTILARLRASFPEPRSGSDFGYVSCFRLAMH